MVNRLEYPKTPPRSPSYSVNFSSGKCEGKMNLVNQEAKVAKAHIQYKNDLSSEVDNYYGEGTLNNEAFIRDGRGTYYYSEGGKYFGNWKSNKKVGLGVFIYSNLVISFSNRDINNKMTNSVIYWPNSSEGYKQVFIGNIEDNTALNGLFYVNELLASKDSNEMTHYLYCGKRNKEDKMNDEEAIFYDFKRNFLFIGAIDNDIIIMGYEIMLSKILVIEDILFIMRNKETNQLTLVVSQEKIASADRNLMFRKANAFIQNYLKNSTLVDYLNGVYIEIKKFSKRTADLMPSVDIMEQLSKRSTEIGHIIKKSNKSTEV